MFISESAGYLATMQTVNCVFVGDKVGKLLESNTGNSNLEYEPLVHDDGTVSVKIIDGQLCSFSLCDTSHQEDYENLTPRSYPQVDVFVICFSVMDRASLNKIKEQLVPKIAYHWRFVPLLLVGTQIDQRRGLETLQKLHTLRGDQSGVSQSVVSLEEGRATAREVEASNYHECSVKQKGLKDVIDAAIQVARMKHGMWKCVFPNYNALRCVVWILLDWMRLIRLFH